MAKKVIPWIVKSLVLECYNENGEKSSTDSYVYKEDITPLPSFLDVSEIQNVISKNAKKLIKGSEKSYSKVLTVKTNKTNLVFAL